MNNSIESELFYLQDKRQYVGNDLLFWAKDGKGYTTDVSKAEIYTKEKAFAQNRSRETDVPWPKSYIDERTRPAVDHQYVDIETALQGIDEELACINQLQNPIDYNITDSLLTKLKARKQSDKEEKV